MLKIRAARSLLRWRAQDLAKESSVGVATIRRAELAEGPTALTAANDQAIRRALELAGVEFIPENGGGLGLRLRIAETKTMMRENDDARQHTSASSSSTRTVADQACAFESRQSRNAESAARFLRNEAQYFELFRSPQSEARKLPLPSS